MSKGEGEVKSGRAKSTQSRSASSLLEYLLAPPPTIHLAHLRHFKSSTNSELATTITDPSSVEVFRYGTTQLIAALPDHIEDNAATSAIRYAMMAVGDDAKKLRILVNAIYYKETDHGDCIATLLVSLIRNTPELISAYVGSKTPQKLVTGSELGRFLVLTRCQTEHEDTMQSGVWLTKSFFVTVRLNKFGCVTDRIIQHLLLAMAESENLFDVQNFEVFAKSIV